MVKTWALKTNTNSNLQSNDTRTCLCTLLEYIPCNPEVPEIGRFQWGLVTSAIFFWKPGTLDCLKSTCESLTCWNIKYQNINKLRNYSHVKHNLPLNIKSKFILIKVYSTISTSMKVNLFNQKQMCNSCKCITWKCLCS